MVDEQPAAQQTAEDALGMALVRYPPAPGLTLHHDQGSQYRSLQYRAKTAKAKIALSMSRPGMPYDNAMIESFFANLKLEINDGRPFASREAARTAIFEYIELFYNRARLHSALGYTTPLQIEQQYQQAGSVP
ncbi:transposase [Stenotrophomonas humi]